MYNMKRTLEAIKKQVGDLIMRCPNITEGEIRKELKLSYRFGTKLFDGMIKKGEICLTN